MDPSVQFCPNSACRDHGARGAGNVTVHSRRTRRYRCRTCRRTFAATSGTPLYRCRTDPALVATVVTLVSCGCPIQAVVAAYGLDERTVADWVDKAGRHAAAVHAEVVAIGAVDARHVQADEVWVRMAGHVSWVALAIAAPTRLWLGGVVSRRRDGALIAALVALVLACTASAAFLVCVDGFSAYVGAFTHAVRVPVRTGRRGRPPLRPPDGFQLARVIKRYAQRHVVAVERAVVHGTEEAVAAVLRATGTGTTANTAYAERFNATLRGRIAPLSRRNRRLLATDARLTAYVYLVGTVYNVCAVHRALDRWRDQTTGWEQRTPAMAAGLTDHPWTVADLLRYRTAAGPPLGTALDRVPTTRAKPVPLAQAA